MGTMTSAAAVVLASLWMVISQPLDSSQHAALMNVYDGFGCASVFCSRFAPTSNCTEPATCIGGKVVHLAMDLVFQQLSGTISSSIGQLTALTSLKIFNALLNGPITSYIGLLTRLTYLELSGNRLSGAIPTYVGQLTALSTLGLADNQLIGSIPTHIGQLTKLHTLFLNKNLLSGTIPPLTSTVTSCTLFTGIDVDQQDCSTAPRNCAMNCAPRTCSPLSMPLSLTTMATQQTRASTSPTQHTSSPTTTSTSGMSTLSMIGTTSMSGVSTLSMIGTPTPTTTTGFGSPTDAMPATPTSDNNMALIGGIIGGIVALLLIIGLIAFIVTRRNRRRNAGGNSQLSNRNDVSMAPAQTLSSNNYGKINAQPASNDYSETFLNKPPSQIYDDAGVLANNYGIANQNHMNQTNYDHPSVLSH